MEVRTESGWIDDQTGTFQQIQNQANAEFFKNDFEFLAKRASEKSPFNKDAKKRYWAHIRIKNFCVGVVVASQCSKNIKTKPIAIKSHSASVIFGCNEIAQNLGVEQSMHWKICLEKCPAIVFLEPDFGLFKKVSDKFYNILTSFDIDAEQIGCDEARLDLTDFFGANGIRTSEEIESFRIFYKKLIAEQIVDTEGIYIGIGPNKLLARLSHKNNQKYDFDESFSDDCGFEFLNGLKLEEDIRGQVPQIGPQTFSNLNKLDIKTIKQVREHLFALYLLVQQTSASINFMALLDLCYGIGDSAHANFVNPKTKIYESMSFICIDDNRLLEVKLDSLVRNVWRKQVTVHGKVGKSIEVKIGFDDWTYSQRKVELKDYLWDFDQVYKLALGQLKGIYFFGKVRELRIEIGLLEDIQKLELAKKRYERFKELVGGNVDRKMIEEKEVDCQKNDCADNDDVCGDKSGDDFATSLLNFNNFDMNGNDSRSLSGIICGTGIDRNRKNTIVGVKLANKAQIEKAVSVCSLPQKPDKDNCDNDEDNISVLSKDWNEHNKKNRRVTAHFGLPKNHIRTQSETKLRLQKKNFEEKSVSDISKDGDYIQKDVNCPICGIVLNTHNNFSFVNRHIDLCLGNNGNSAVNKKDDEKLITDRKPKSNTDNTGVKRRQQPSSNEPQLQQNKKRVKKGNQSARSNNSSLLNYWLNKK